MEKESSSTKNRPTSKHDNMNCSPTPLNIQKKYSSQTLLEAKAKPLTYSDIFGEIRNPGSIKAPSP